MKFIGLTIAKRNVSPLFCLELSYATLPKALSSFSNTSGLEIGG